MQKHASGGFDSRKSAAKRFARLDKTTVSDWRRTIPTQRRHPSRHTFPSAKVGPPSQRLSSIVVYPQWFGESPTVKLSSLAEPLRIHYLALCGIVWYPLRGTFWHVFARNYMFFTVFFFDIIKSASIFACMSRWKSWEKRRVGLGLRKTELAKKAGVSIRTIYRLEAGETSISEETKNKIKLALKN